MQLSADAMAEQEREKSRMPARATLDEVVIDFRRARNESTQRNEDERRERGEG